MVIKKKIRDRIKSIVWAVSTFQGEEYVRQLCREKYELSEKETDQAIEEARKRIVAASQYDLTEELGQALTRNNYLYEATIKAQDLKTAARILRDRQKLLKLETGRDTQQGEVIDYNPEVDMLTEEIETARKYLEAIEGARPGLRLEDLARFALAKSLEAEKRKITDDRNESAEG